MKALRSDERTSINALDVDECLVLMRWEVIGRLAVSIPGSAPLVVPINFAMDGDTILFRSDEGTKLVHGLQHPVSVQVDRFDWYRRIGWSVLVQGVAAECDPEEVGDVDLSTWAPGDMRRIVRITPTSITGRRLELNLRALEPRGYL